MPKRQAIHKRLPPHWRARARRLGRLRWYAKYRGLRRSGVPFRPQPATYLKHVFLDPEVDNFTYELDNAEELAPFLAGALGVPLPTAEQLLAEAEQDEELHDALTRRVRWRFDTKRRLHLGRRVLWYAIVRHVRPKLVVEVGVQEGLGTLVLLRALERNAHEGAPGRLTSIDPLPSAGWLVPERLRAGWTFVNARSEEGLAETLDGQIVDVLLSDSGGDYHRELFELEQAVQHGSPSLVLIAGSGDHTTALPEISAQHGLRYSRFAERPKAHFFRGTATAVAVRPPAQG